MTDIHDARLVLVRGLAACGLLFALTACGSESAAVGPEPEPDPDPVDTEPHLECGLPDHPCAWSDVSASVIDRTLDLADQGLAMLGEGSTSADVDAWLDAQDDVVEVQSDALAIRFRVDGGRGMWIYRRGATLSGPGLDAAPVAAAPESSGAPERHVVGDAPAKRALVLSPQLWQFGDQWDDGAEVAAIFEATRGYEGGVAYRKNETETATEVGPAAFTDWNTFDVVYFTGHGRRVCDSSECRGTLTIGALSTVIPSGESETAKILQLDEMGLELRISEETGKKSVLVAADFFREAYPGGLDDTLVFLNACQTQASIGVDVDIVDALRKGGRTVVLGWSDVTKSNDAIAASQAFFESLSKQGYPARVAWEKLGDLRTGEPDDGTDGDGTVPVLGLEGPTDGSDLHIREVVTLLNPHSGAKLESSPTVSIVGEADDGQPDAAPFRVLVEGILEDFAGDMTVYVTVDGVDADPIPLADGVRNDQDAWQVEGIVQLPYDLTDDRSVTVVARATLHSGGESTHETNAVLTGSSPLMGYEWEFVATHSTYWVDPIPNTPHWASSVLTLEFAPGQDPSDPTPVYLVTGGTVTWDYSHTYYDCVFSSPEVTFEVTEEIALGSWIEFDTTTEPVTYTGYVRTFGPLVPITQQCDDSSSAREHRASNTWMRVESDAPRPVAADGMSITGSHYFTHVLTNHQYVQESHYTITRVR